MNSPLGPGAKTSGRSFELGSRVGVYTQPPPVNSEKLPARSSNPPTIFTQCFFLPGPAALCEFAYSLGRVHALYSLSPEHNMSSYKVSPAEAILVDLVHDLRQYLGNIETSVYCLELQSESTHVRSRGYLRTIQQQLAHADSRLSDAGAALNSLRTQRRDGEEILALTNSATSAVT